MYPMVTKDHKLMLKNWFYGVKCNLWDRVLMDSDVSIFDMSVGLEHSMNETCLLTLFKAWCINIKQSN